jgi:hypothetical protein
MRVHLHRLVHGSTLHGGVVVVVVVVGVGVLRTNQELVVVVVVVVGLGVLRTNQLSSHLRIT